MTQQIISHHKTSAQILQVQHFHSNKMKKDFTFAKLPIILIRKHPYKNELLNIFTAALL